MLPNFFVLNQIILIFVTFTDMLLNFLRKPHSLLNSTRLSRKTTDQLSDKPSQCCDKKCSFLKVNWMQ